MDPHPMLRWPVPCHVAQSISRASLASLVALTAFAMKGDDQKALAAGCDGYITKPIDTRKLPEQVASYLRAAERETYPDERAGH